MPRAHLGPPDPEQPTVSTADVDARLRQALAVLSVRDAVDKVAAETGLKRREVYARALALTMS